MGGHYREGRRGRRGWQEGKKENKKEGKKEDKERQDGGWGGVLGVPYYVFPESLRTAKS